MLLVIDLGNTNTVVGLYEQERLLQHWRLATVMERTTDEYGILIRELLLLSHLSELPLTAMMISCVVPPLLPVIQEMARKYFKLEPLVVEPGIKTGMPILYDNPHEVGADRIVNGVAAYARYGGPVIVVDFGTATTFDAISGRGEYVGGAIAPGIAISMEALFRHAAKLPRIELVKPKAVIGKSTITSMQAGLIYGYVGLVDGIVHRMIDELGQSPAVVATGGVAGLIAPETKTIQQVDPLLTLEGLRILYQRNRSAGD